MENKKNINPYLMPISVIIAGLLVAGAVLYTQNNNSNTRVAPAPQAQRPVASGSAENVKPISSEDHIKGDPNALVKVIEFSDTECPFCKRFHPTMQRIIDEYGKDGRVVWVYRHFPLDSIHSKARLEESATELAAELGGNDKFWEYLDKLFEIAPSNDRLDLNMLPKIAEDIGLDRKPFEAIVSENDRSGGKYAGHIRDNYNDGITSGVTGTPYSIVIAPNGKKFAINGAQSYSTVKSIIDLALNEK
jgi:protein-disulfide isomerase